MLRVPSVSTDVGKPVSWRVVRTYTIHGIRLKGKIMFITSYRTLRRNPKKYTFYIYVAIFNIRCTDVAAGFTSRSHTRDGRDERRNNSVRWTEREQRNKRNHPSSNQVVNSIFDIY